MSADFYSRILIIYFLFRIKISDKKHKTKHYFVIVYIMSVIFISLNQTEISSIQVISYIVVNYLDSWFSCNNHTFVLQYLTTTSNSSGSMKYSMLIMYITYIVNTIQSL